ncbi:MAG: YqgE/AlgH family protein [Tannerella sp.]|jgi:putative transcriptional regulator|nr:YqgE/AlgH family protein [Tannerella sp.]
MASYDDIFKIKHNGLPPGKGKILISEPFSQEACFQRAVVLLIEHSIKDSMGLVVNKPTDLIVNNFLPELKSLPDIPVFQGGPVGFGQLVFFIHSLGPDTVPDSMWIREHLYMGGNLEALKNYLSEGHPTKGTVKFFSGYAGWESNQLNMEILRNSWLVSHSSPENILLAEDDSYWNHALEELGDPYRTWTNYPKSPNMN